MTDKKTTDRKIKSKKPEELSEDELSKAQGGYYKKITFEGVKADPTPGSATPERK